MHGPEPAARLGAPADEGAGAPECEAVMEMLADRVPISLIMDLAMPAGPHSQELLDEEGEPEHAWWEQG